MAEAVKVSVVVPHYNRIDLVGQTLASVRAQTYPDWELILVDDASREDPTTAVSEMMRGHDARIIRLEQNGGVSNARNVGVAAASGRFVAFLDSDDLWEPEKLARQVDAAMKRPEPDKVICYTANTVFGRFGPITVMPKRSLGVGEAPCDYLFLNDGFVQTSSLFVGRALAQANPFDTRLRSQEDPLFFLQAMARGADYVFVDEPLTRWRNDERPDRLSGRAFNEATNGRRFLEIAEPHLTPAARTAFIVKGLGLQNLRHYPVSTLGHFITGMRTGIVTPRYTAWQILRAVMGPERFDRLRGRDAPVVFGVEQRPASEE